MSEDHTRTVSNAHYMEIVAKAMFMDSIMVVLDVSKPQDALQRVKELVPPGSHCQACGKVITAWNFYTSDAFCPTCR